MRRRQPTVHVLDDDPSFRRAITRLLRAVGYHVPTYGSVDAFLSAAVLSRPLSCVVSDVRMPTHSGLHLRRVLRETGLPVVFVTAFCDRQFEEQALADGALGVLSKPVCKGDLIDAVERALAASQEPPTESPAM